MIVEYLTLPCGALYRIAAKGFPFDAAWLDEYWRFDRWLFGLLFGSTVGKRSQIGL